MIKSNTVFILGAGAGHDIKMPLGVELANRIFNSLVVKTGVNGEHLQNSEIQRAVMNITPDLRELIGEAKIIRDGILLAKSIDEFVDSFPNRKFVAKVAKIAIASSILESEKSSSLYVRTDNIYNRLSLTGVSNSWMVEFFRILSAGASEGDFKSALARVSFINFNYDRCLEHFLVQAISARFAVSLEMAIEAVAQIEIVHPYGHLGTLTGPGQSNPVQFGERGNINLSIFGNRLLTYTESNAVGSEALNKMGQILKEANYIYTLGFAFHEPNLKLLSQLQIPKVKRIFATTMGMSEFDRSVVKGWLRDWTFESGLEGEKQPEPLLYSEGCDKFIREYAKAISD